MKKFINVLAILLALVMCLGIVVACRNEEDDNGTDETTTTAATTTTPAVTTTTATGTTPTDPIIGERISTPTVDVPADGNITSAAELHAVLVNGASDQNYTVNAAKLDMSPYTWEGMIGFTGTFDFGGCTIEGAVDSLFISVFGGTVKNLTIANSTYSYAIVEAANDINPVTNKKGNLYYSPVVRYATDIVVDNVTIESTVSISSDIWENHSSHGGIVGMVNGTNVLISNCTFNGQISTFSRLVRLGGIAGSIEGTDVSCVSIDAPETSLSRIERCTNNGLVQNLGVAVDSKSGGVVGYMSNTAAVYCANYGEMDSSDSGQTGGVIGYVANTIYIKNCINTGKVKGAEYVGGICAYSNAKGSARYFENSINLGKVESAIDSYGGIIGLTKDEEKIINCFNLCTEAGTLKFSHEYNTDAAVDPADSTTYGKLVVTNSANLDSVDAIFNAIDIEVSGVFVKTADGASIVLADAQ